MTEISIELPEGNAKELNRELLTNLIFKAFITTIALLKKIKPSNKFKLIYTKHNNESFSGSYIPFPDYREEKVYNRIDKIWDHNEFISLSNYLWEHNTYKLTLGGENEKPTKKGWAQFVFLYIIHGPLLNMLEYVGVKSYINNSKIKAWHVENEDISTFTENCAEHIIERQQNIQTLYGLCTVRNIKIEENNIDEVELCDGVKIKKMSDFDKCMFKTLYQYEFLWDDFVTPVSIDSYVEVKIKVKLKQKNEIDRDLIINQIKRYLDILKLALFMVSSKTRPFIEGTCLIQNIMWDRVAKFRRQDSYNYQTYNIGNEHIENIKLIFVDIIKCAKKSPDLDYAIWHFGRSCISSLNEDILLNSALGLDILLVPGGGGDSKYKFCLHGSGIIPHSDIEDDVYKLMEEIYKKRSNAAHGKRVKNIDILAKKSRNLLSSAIYAILNLEKDGYINIEDKKSISLAVQDYAIIKVKN